VGLRYVCEMVTTLLSDAFGVDTIPDLSALAHPIFHRLVLQDAQGKRAETPGVSDSFGTLALYDARGFPKDFVGKTVLDVGCNGGFYSLVAKLRGVTSVVGVDHSEHHLNQAILVRDALGIESVEFKVADVTRIDEFGLGMFDYVINIGVIYQLENPFDYLRRVSLVTRNTMFLESEMLIDQSLSDYAWFIEKAYRGDQTNWWICGPNCLVGMARSAGFSEADFRGMAAMPPQGKKTQEGYEMQGRGVVICRK
jgi:tRNA (mo5U34)-methyltransferase